MKRYSWLHISRFTESLGSGFIRAHIVNRRVGPEHMPRSIHGYVLSAYAGWRGSFRIRSKPVTRYVHVSGAANVDFHVLPVTGFTSVIARRTRLTEDKDDTVLYESATQFETSMDRTWTGEQVAIEVQGQTTAIELPFYGIRRFFTSAQNLAFRHAVYYNASPSQPFAFIALQDEFFAATGDDFNCFFFLGVPAIWVSPNP